MIKIGELNVSAPYGITEKTLGNGGWDDTWFYLSTTSTTPIPFRIVQGTKKVLAGDITNGQEVRVDVQGDSVTIISGTEATLKIVDLTDYDPRSPGKI